MSDSAPTPSAWQPLRDSLGRLTAIAGDETAGRRRLYAFAEEFLTFVRAYHGALTAEGKTSVRVEVALRALSLGTPRSALEKARAALDG